MDELAEKIAGEIALSAISPGSTVSKATVKKHAGRGHYSGQQRKQA